MVINTNTTSLFAQRVLANSHTGLSKSLARLSTGSKIISPEDDAAGLAVSSKFKAQIDRVGAARSNVGNAISFSQTQDGFLQTIYTGLRRMSELATLSADNTKSNSDVDNYNKEFQELKSFIKSSSAKQFNGVDLFGANLADNLGGTVGGVAVDADIKAKYDAMNTALAALKGTVNTANEEALQLAIVQLGVELKQYDGGWHALDLGDGSGGAPDSTPGNDDKDDYAAAITFFTSANYLNDSSIVLANFNITSQTGIDAYTGFATNIKTLVDSRFGGIDVTDSSEATTYSMKGVDLTALKDDMEIATGNLQTLTKTTAQDYVGKLTVHINSLAGNRANIGANISRLNMVNTQLAVYGENLGAANSRIEDVDVAVESANYAKQQILVQSGTAMLSQANVLPQSALRLLE